MNILKYLSLVYFLNFNRDNNYFFNLNIFVILFYYNKQKFKY